MSNVYDIFQGGNKPYNKEEWAAQKQAERKEAYELADTTCVAMKTDSKAFEQYLNIQGRFDRYSVTNALLVAAQMPEATQLRDYNKWKENRVYTDKKAKKVMILEPGKEYIRDDNTKAVSYNAKAVYDISQTSAKNNANEMEPARIRDLVGAMIDASPVPFQPTDNMEIPAFYDKEQQTIFLKKGLSEEQLFVSMAREVATAIYDFKHNKVREEVDFKTYCVAYMIGSKYGVDIGGFQFEHLPQEYAEMDTQTFKNELGSMRDVLGEINSEVYKSLEKSKAAKSKEQER